MLQIHSAILTIEEALALLGACNTLEGLEKAQVEQLLFQAKHTLSALCDPPINANSEPSHVDALGK